MKKFVMIASALALAPLGAAQAATTVSVTPAGSSYSGPTPTYDFETLAPIIGGTVKSNTVGGVAIRPGASTGNFYAVGGVNGSPAVLSLAAFAKIGSLSFLWGTPDDFNLFEILDGSNQVVASYTGTAIKALMGSGADTLISFHFTDATVDNVKSLRFTSSRAAFEFDNVAVGAIPEPGVWAMMLIGFAAMGFSLRRREKTKLRVRFA
jgi:PEP-CTERM motif